MRVRLKDEKGNLYIYRADTLKPAKERKRTVKFATSKAQDKAYKRTAEAFTNYPDAGLIVASFAKLLQGVIDEDFSSFSIGTYQGSMQATFWSKVNGKAQVIGAFDFSTPERFISEIEEHS